MKKLWKKPQLSLNIHGTEEDEEVKQEQQPPPASEPPPKKEVQMLKPPKLNDTSNSMMGSMSCELNSKGLKVAREDFEIDQLGMKNISSGQLIVGNLQKEDLEIQQVIGNGACGYVYKAIHRPTGKALALKSINAFDKGKRHQLINDLRSLHKNACPFLVEFCGALFEEGSVKVALEYMDMGSLKNIIKLAKLNPLWNVGQPLISEPVLSKMVQQMLAGLCYLNVCKKQLHRDIKPDNILVNKSGFVKLTDFGISIQLDETGQLAKSFVGTLTYMSPERMEGEKYSAKGDIWSLGLVIVEMMTGVFPYPETRGFLEMLEQIKDNDSPNVPDNGCFTRELQHFITCCLQKDPRERYSEVQLLAHPWILRYSQLDADLPRYFQTLLSYQSSNNNFE